LLPLVGVFAEPTSASLIGLEIRKLTYIANGEGEGGLIMPVSPDHGVGR
jgi:hypothetical protein